MRKIISLVSIVIIISFSFSGVAYPLAPQSQLGRIAANINREEIRKAVLTEDWKYIFKNIKDAETESDLVEFLRACSKASAERKTHPIEARYPVLKAIALLDRKEQQALVSLLKKENGGLRKEALVDSILLMLDEEVPSGWVSQQAPNLAGRTIWEIAAEVWYAGGGLGRVMQYHSRAMERLIEGSGAKVCVIEPYYHLRRDKKGELEELDYRGLNIPVTSIKEFGRFTVKVRGKDVEAIAYRGVNSLGMEVYLVRDRDRYYTRMQYAYDTPDNPVKWEEFTEFFSRASLELVRVAEEKKRKRVGVSDFKPPVIHINDSQLAPFALFKKMLYSDNPALKEALVAFTTHTYRNRGIFSHPDGMRILADMGIPNELIDPLFSHSGFGIEYPVIDFASVGLRAADWQGGVSAIHVDEVGRYDKGIELIGVTNGDDRAATATVFSEILLKLYSDADIEQPTPQQIMGVKKEAKRRLGLNPEQIVISYSGRLVGEKAGRQRAFTDENIEGLVKRGAQLVIYGNVQGTDESKGIYRSLLELKARLDGSSYSGSLHLVGSFTLDEQRALLAATDVQVQDSDRATGACEFTEADINACGGLQFSPPWREGLIKDQGILLNFKNIGEGNTIIPKGPNAEDYLAAFKKIVDLSKDHPENLAEYQAASIRLSRILEAELTAAEYLRQFSGAFEKSGVGRPLPLIAVNILKGKVRFPYINIIQTRDIIREGAPIEVEAVVKFNGTNPEETDFYFWYGSHNDPKNWRAIKGIFVTSGDGTVTFKAFIIPLEVGPNGVTGFVVPKSVEVVGRSKDEWKQFAVWRNRTENDWVDVNFTVGTSREALAGSP